MSDFLYMGSVKKEERQSVFFCMGRLLFLLALLMVRVRWGNRFEENRPAAGGRISERDPMRQLQKKMAGGYFFAWWCCGGGGGSFVSSHSLDGVGSDKLRKTAPATARVDSPSATCAEESRRWFSDLLQGAAVPLPSSRRASLRATLLPRQSFFWWALNFSFSLRSELVVEWKISNFDFFCVSFPVIMVTSKMTCSHKTT